MNERLKPYEDKMKKTLANLEGELVTIRAGRANPNVLNKITVDYYGTPTPIQQVANVSVPEARMIQIQPWEKSMLKVIEKASWKAIIIIEVFMAALILGVFVFWMQVQFPMCLLANLM